ncbi:PIN domain-containing protein [Blastococcus capsensis]|uniref:PIN domain-containing protein n=1 Tax=Blastococcus capsensis TaxID=1564163 RepID=UPI002542659A|nr:PIN domain-containing protein [Blastococcus capsensis]MDK3255196.1 PIN domain-containing protein [Blastococcus capsensis]
MDTDVWSPLFMPGRKAHPSVARWRTLLTGRTIVISEQTRAEVIGGLLDAGMGPARARAAIDQLNRTATVPVDDALADTCAQVYANCKRIGHPLHAKDHTGDRWIAATAIHTGLPLLSNDGIFRDVPGLVLLEQAQVADEDNGG